MFHQFVVCALIHSIVVRVLKIGFSFFSLRYSGNWIDIAYDRFSLYIFVSSILGVQQTFQRCDKVGV